jgi:methylphosphotriester-DNA--protein-cysteine methyltransferase
LQAHLKTAGTSYADIRSRVLYEAALKELSGGRSIQQTAAFLGVNHRQSFSEAISKWEAQAPSVFASRGRAAAVLP